jgi:type IV pilus assembly protein PilM
MAIKQQTRTIIDIGAYAVKLMQLNSGGKIVRYAVERLPEGCVKGMFIEAEEPLIRALRTARQKSGSAGGKCILTLSGKDMIVRHLTLPKLPEKQLYQNVLLEMAGYLPVDTDKQIIDYKILEEIRENDNTLYRLMVATIHKKILERFSLVLKKAGFTISVLDANENAQEKFVRSPIHSLLSENRDKGICIVDMGAETTNVNLFHDGRFFAGYLLNKGGARITQLVAQHLQADIITAENYKLKNDLFSDEKVDPALRQSVKNEIDSLIYEISKVADYYWSRTNKPLGCIVLSGGATLLTGLQQYIISNVRLNIYTPQTLLKNYAANKNFADSLYAYLFNDYAASFREEAK